jgi:hypothetical protein
VNNHGSNGMLTGWIGIESFGIVDAFTSMRLRFVRSPEGAS